MLESAVQFIGTFLTPAHIVTYFYFINLSVLSHCQKGEYEAPGISVQSNIIPGTLLYSFSSIVGYVVTAADATPRKSAISYDRCMLEAWDAMDLRKNIAQIVYSANRLN